MSVGRRIWVVLACCVALFACSEDDENVLDDVGVVRVVFVDTALRSQLQVLDCDPVNGGDRPCFDEKTDITDPGLPPIAAQWRTTSLIVTIGDRAPIALGGPCVFTDSADRLPVATGPCQTGFVVDAVLPAPIELEVTVNAAQLLRSRPADLPGCVDPIGNPDDCDGDRIANHVLVGGGAFQNDSCLWVPGPHRHGRDFVYDPAIEDGIGDECQEDSRDELADAVISATFPAVAPASGGILYLVVDLSHDRAVSGLDWGAIGGPGTFAIDETQARVCVATSISRADAGCPP
jgi:hypothetical protein